MRSTVTRRFIGMFVGLIFGAAYGLWTMLATGGGHGNFIWLLLFLYAELLGFFFPILGFVLPDLRPIWAKAVAFWLLAANLLITIFTLIFGGVGEDIQKSWRRDSVFFIFLAIVHFVPLLLCVIYVFSKWSTDEETELADGPTSILR